MSQPETLGASRSQLRSEIVDVAADLLRRGGPEAVTTRAVAGGAGVQAPTIYRLFGDKDGLLDAAADLVYAGYVDHKGLDEQTDDPAVDLRAGWQAHLRFGLANPGLFALLAHPDRGTRSPASAAGLDVLTARVHRIAVAGRLRVAEPRAVEMIHAGGTGAILALLARAPDERDAGLPDAVYEAIMRAVLVDEAEAPVPGPAAAATALRASVAELRVLSRAEQTLMSEWLDRVIDQ